MTGTFFDDKMIELPPECVGNGGCWRPHNGGAQAWDSDLLRWIYQNLAAIQYPVFFDIGANTGSVCLMAKHLPGSHCVAFEPGRATWSALTKAIVMNDLQNQIDLKLAAVMNESEPGLLYVPNTEETGMAAMACDAVVTNMLVETVECIRLDDYISNSMMMDKIDLMSIDVEGAEPLVLDGAIETLKRFSPGLVIEWMPKFFARFNRSENDVLNLLHSMGYDGWEPRNDTDRYFFKKP